MPKIYKILFLVVVAVTAKTNVTAQVVTNDSVNIRNSKAVSDTIVPYKNKHNQHRYLPFSVNVALKIFSMQNHQRNI